MFYQNVIEPYIRLTEQNPDQTVARIDGQVYSYAQLAQRIAPIMNELDAMLWNMDYNLTMMRLSVRIMWNYY